MDERQYFQLSEVCDALLKAEDTSLPRIAIPWLHILNEHPAHLAGYADLFARHGTSRFRGVKQLAYLLWILRPRFNRERPWYGLPSLPDRADVVFVSHLLNKSQLGAAEDFYFGELPGALGVEGLTTVVALLDHTGMDLRHLARYWTANSAPRVVFSRSLGWLDELKLWMQLRKEACILRGLSARATSKLQKDICDAAAVQAVTPSSLATFRLYSQFQNLVERLRPSSIVVTYEGHAWERIVFAAARAVNPAIRCVGYQHAVLFPRSHAIKRLLGWEYDPDVICTGGQVTHDVLASVPQLRDVPVVTVGTHRQEGSKSVLEHKLVSAKPPACLVIPDGTLGECLLILGFVLAAAKAATDVNFVVRMHPVMPFASVIAKDKRFRAMPRNIEISDKSINDDFARCRWAVYRGSGAAIRAVIAGLRPFYFKPYGERLTIDPLYSLEMWRCIVSTPSDLLDRIQHDLASDSETLESEMREPRQFCTKYFTPINLELFSRQITFWGRTSQVLHTKTSGLVS